MTTSTPANIEDLTDRLDLLNGELHIIADLLDQLRTDFQWGLQNGRVQLVLSDSESLEQSREATVGADAVTLTIRLNAALGLFHEEIAAVIEEQRTKPVAEPDAPAMATENPADIDTNGLPPVTFFDVGDAVEFELDGEIWFGEIADLDDAANAAIVQLIPSYEEADVPQDLLRRIEPDVLSRRWAEIEAVEEEEERLANSGPRRGDRLTVSQEGHDIEGEVTTVDPHARTAQVVLTPTMEVVTLDWSEIPWLNPSLIEEPAEPPPASSVASGDESAAAEPKPTAGPIGVAAVTKTDRASAYEEWCHEVRDPARQHSEGRRFIRTANGKAVVEYEIAPLPSGEWAVTWRHGFMCGDFQGAGHPWTTRPTRDDCINLVLQTSRQMFAANTLDRVQLPIARQMLHLLGEGLFGFHEPEPVVQLDDDDLNGPVSSDLPAIAQAAADSFGQESP